VVTDERGAYSIVDLRPGVYGLTFTLVGFSTYTTRQPRTSSELHRHSQRRNESWIARGDDHRLRGEPDRGRADRQESGLPPARADGLDSNRANGAGLRTTRSRHHQRRPRRRRRSRRCLRWA
jgi:hypothetical protein